MGVFEIASVGTSITPTLPLSHSDTEKRKSERGEEWEPAYLALVDRLLASPRYGERWARPWLDLARYGDSAGYQHDMDMPLWPYRVRYTLLQHEGRCAARQ